MTNIELDILNYIRRKKLISEDEIREFKVKINRDNVNIGKLLADELFPNKEEFKKFINELLKNNIITLFDFEESFFTNIEEILKSFAKSLNAIYFDLDRVEIDYKLTSVIPIGQLKKYLVLPLYAKNEDIYVSFGDPYNLKAQEIIQRYYPKKSVKVVISNPSQIVKYFNKIEINNGIKKLVEEIEKELLATKTEVEGELSNIMKLIEYIIKSAILNRGSDIHIEPTYDSCVVRNRIDGMLVETFVFKKIIYPPLGSRIKLLSNLDIAQRRKPQDGRFSLKIMDREYDFRVSTLPIIDGESIVIRVLDKTKVMINIESLGMNKINYEKFCKAMRVPYGIIFVTGPTGSGKTTTLYGALNAIKSVRKKIITVEDPIEYQLNLIQQVQVNKKMDLTFANILKSVLRQDPDVIMIGEVRDKETLKIAIQAALTGHLVFSTLHTNDAISAIDRVLDMGIESYLVSGALIAIEAQRLIRRLCPYCKSKIKLPKNILEELEEVLPENYQFYKAVGCDKCANSGYFGREMVSEILTVTDEIQSIIAKGGSKKDIIKQAKVDGFSTMFEDGILRASQGITTYEEICRVVKM